MVQLYTLNCSVCQGQFNSKDDWLRHLSSDEHQFLARKECLQDWSTSSKVKECCLVIFSNFPLIRPKNGYRGGAHKVIGYFSKDPKTFVTDFICWVDRPCIGLLQFESRKKVDEVLASCQDSEEIIVGSDHQRIQVKRAVDLLQFEWSSILPDGEERRKPEINLSNDHAGNKRALDPSPEDSQPDCLKRLKPDGPDSTKFSLQNQFDSLQKHISISPEDFSKQIKIVQDLKLLFHRKDPTAHAHMFRNRFLKLQSPVKGHNKFLIYVYNARSQGRQDFSCLTEETLQEIFNLPDALKQFSILESPEEDNDPGLKIGWKVTHRQSGANIRLVTSPQFIVEVQLNRLVTYLCKFDSRCHPLMILGYHWAKMNRLFIGEIDSEFLPEPNSLQWLVIFFLSFKGIIPTPREILARPHKILKEMSTGRDVGFDADPNFIQEWKASKGPPGDMHEPNLAEIDLFRDFLHFCGNTLNSPGNCILNTRDGQIIPGEFTKSDLKMGAEEAAELRSQNFGNLKIYMTNPFSFSWNLSISENIGLVLKCLKATELRLNQFMEMRQNVGVWPAHKRFGSLQYVLQLSKKIIADIEADVTKYK